MIPFLLGLLILFQGLPTPQTGTITGVLRNEDGKPAVGVRVTAMPQIDSLQGDTGPTMSSLAETDSQGRFTLESVPPGRYYVAAGRLDLPTFYPGTQSMALGQNVQVTPGATVRNIDFALNSTSTGRAEPALFGAALTLLDLPLNVTVEGGGKLPFFSDGQFTTIKLTGSNGVTSIPIRTSRVGIVPPITDYRVTIEGLPDGYAVKSMKYGSAELTDRILRVTSFVGPNGIVWANGTAYTTALGLTPAGNNAPAAFNRASGQQVFSIVLDSAATRSRQSTGIAVRGTLNGATPRALYLSDAPGTVFVDGSFEFHNVPRGRHIIMTRNNTTALPPLTAVVVVADRDVENVDLQSTPVLPRKVATAASTQPAATSPGGVVPLPSVQGRILDAETGLPVNSGTLYLVGDSWASLSLGAEGRFDFQHLLPGIYEVEVQAVGYPTLRREVIVGEQDIQIELKVGS